MDARDTHDAKTAVMVRWLPNKRLKLAGADRFKGSGVLCPWRGTDFVPHPCAGGRGARRLSPLRYGPPITCPGRGTYMSLLKLFLALGPILPAPAIAVARQRLPLIPDR